MKEAKPKFGKPVFEIEEGDIRDRVIIEYKEDASPAMVWDDRLNMIIFDYLQPENPLSEGIYMTYIPDGTYRGFYFDKRKSTGYCSVWSLIRPSTRHRSTSRNRRGRSESL